MNRGSVLAVVAGLLAIIVVTTLVDIVLHAVHVFPPLKEPINNRLAPANPMKHALILGYVGVVLALIGLASTWNLGLGPRWYPVALVVLAIPQCWAGGKLYQLQTGNPPAAT